MTRRTLLTALAVAFMVVGVADAASPPAPTPPGSAQAVTDTLLQAATARVASAIWWTETSNSSLAASTNFSGTARSSGGTAGNVAPYSYYQATFISSQSGTAYVIQNGTGVVIAQQSVSAGVSYTIKVPAFYTALYAQFNNQTTATTLTIVDGYTMF